MTTTDPIGNPPGTGPNTCANCFAEFEWTPFVQDGEDFCCSGCADGGPCICTYDGAPHLTNQDSPTSGVSASGTSEESELDEEVPAATAGDGAPPEPPEQPLAPADYPEDDEEPPTNGRLAIIMAAISEMPLPVQEVVQARLSNPGSDESIGAPLGLTAEEVRALIEQGQAILDRTIGSTFSIRYIGAEELPVDDEPEPEFPTFDEVEEEEQPEATEPSPDQTELRDLIARSFSSLADASTGAGLEDQDSRAVLSETLREVGNLLRIASDRLVADEPAEIPLRDALADRSDFEEPVTLVVENQPEIADFLIALQGHESVLWAKLVSHTAERTEISLVISSMMGFVRDVMTMEGAFRPSRLQMGVDQITIELPEQHAVVATAEEDIAPQAPLPVAATNGAKPAPLYEMSVDSFFGARHFIESGQGGPHHHSYRVEATFNTAEPDGNGFAVGFASVREMVDSTVMVYSETLLNTEDPFREIAPTTENLARVFHDQVSARLHEMNVPSVSLRRIRVWESPVNSASYSANGATPAPTADSETGTGTHAPAAS